MSRDRPARPRAVETEPTPEGDQMLIAGVRPLTLRDRLALRAAAPLAPTKPQKPCDLGLFDMGARNQTDLIDLIRAADRGASSTPEPKEDKS